MKFAVSVKDIEILMEYREKADWDKKNTIWYLNPLKHKHIDDFWQETRSFAIQERSHSIWRRIVIIISKQQIELQYACNSRWFNCASNSTKAASWSTTKSKSKTQQSSMKSESVLNQILIQRN